MEFENVLFESTLNENKFLYYLPSFLNYISKKIKTDNNLFADYFINFFENPDYSSIQKYFALQLLNIILNKRKYLLFIEPIIFKKINEYILMNWNQTDLIKKGKSFLKKFTKKKIDKEWSLKFYELILELFIYITKINNKSNKEYSKILKDIKNKGIKFPKNFKHIKKYIELDIVENFIKKKIKKKLVRNSTQIEINYINDFLSKINSLIFSKPINYEGIENYLEEISIFFKKNKLKLNSAINYNVIEKIINEYSKNINNTKFKLIVENIKDIWNNNHNINNSNNNKIINDADSINNNEEDLTKENMNLLNIIQDLKNKNLELSQNNQDLKNQLVDKDIKIGSLNKRLENLETNNNYLKKINTEVDRKKFNPLLKEKKSNLSHNFRTGYLNSLYNKNTINTKQENIYNKIKQSFENPVSNKIQYFKTEKENSIDRISLWNDSNTSKKYNLKNYTMCFKGIANNIKFDITNVYKLKSNYDTSKELGLNLNNKRKLYKFIRNK